VKHIQRVLRMADTDGDGDLDRQEIAGARDLSDSQRSKLRAEFDRVGELPIKRAIKVLVGEARRKPKAKPKLKPKAPVPPRESRGGAAQKSPRAAKQERVAAPEVVAPVVRAPSPEVTATPVFEDEPDEPEPAVAPLMFSEPEPEPEPESEPEPEPDPEPEPLPLEAEEEAEPAMELNSPSFGKPTLSEQEDNVAKSYGEKALAEFEDEAYEEAQNLLAALDAM